MGADIFAVIGRKIVVDVVDVGAMSLADDHDVYYQLTRANAARVTGFEPIADECAKRNADAPEGLHHGTPAPAKHRNAVFPRQV